MKVFISWSGQVSRSVALALRDWLPYVLNAIDPYVSSEDIDKGSRWSNQIARELDSSNFGIICVTKDNMDAPWLNFEAGALAKSFESGRVTPFLLGITPADIQGPLSQFQATSPDHEDVEKLVRALNNVCEHPISDERISETVAVWWPKLEKVLTSIASQEPAPAASRRELRDIMEEVLTISRATQRTLAASSNEHTQAEAEFIKHLVWPKLRRDSELEAQQEVIAILREIGVEEYDVQLLGNYLVITIPHKTALPVEQTLEIQKSAEKAGLEVKIARLRDR